MAYKVVMPKAGMAMETGIVAKWLKQKGDRVEKGEPLISIETDKTTMEVESMYSGVLLEILAEEGEEVPVVQTIAYIGEPGEVLPEEDKKAAVGETNPAEEVEMKPEAAAVNETAGDLQGQNQNTYGKIAATPAARRAAAEKGIDLAAVVPSGSFGQVKLGDVLEQSSAQKATPLAKAIAKDRGVSIGDISGSGYDGKVTKRDVLLAGQNAEYVQSAEDELVPHSSMRKVIAKRMLQSHQEIPPVTQTCMPDVTELMKLRTQINAGLADDKRVTLNDFIILATARALRKHPYVNASYKPEGMLLKKDINVGVAVAVDSGLIVPVIKNADRLLLTEVNQTAKILSSKAREGNLSPDEYSGGTFTISNLGMMGVTSFTPIINQPEIAILGICAAQQLLEMDEEGNISKKFKMPLCLTYDHRCIDGAQAALFSNTIVSLLENPLLLLI